MSNPSSAAEILDAALIMLQNTAFPVENADDRPMSHFDIRDSEGNPVKYTPAEARSAFILALEEYIQEIVRKEKGT